MKIGNGLLLVILSSVAACTSIKEPVPDTLRVGDYTPVVEYMSRYIQKEMKKASMIGLSAALVDDQQIVWSDGFGYADKENKLAATDDTLYRAGSVSKIFTATAVMQLHEQEKLDIDLPLVRSVPDFTLNSRFGSTDTISLRHTLTHHGGIPGNYFDGMWTDQPDSYQTLPALLQDAYTTYKPNTVFAYSNVGYSLAGLAVENTAQKPFVDYMQSSLLDRLGMVNSNFAFDMDHPHAAKAYWKGKEVRELALRDLPAGGLVSSVEDMAQFLRMIHNGGVSSGQRVLQQATLDEMLSLQSFNNPYKLNTPFGIGWFRFFNYLNGHHYAVGHGGQTMAHSAFLITIPELKLGLVLMSNSWNLGGQLEKIAMEFIRVAYPVKTGNALPERATIAKRELPGSATSFAGEYTSELGYVDIVEKNNRNTINLMNKKFSLRGDDENGYQIKYKLFGFIPINAGYLSRIRIYAREVNGEKIIVGEDLSELGLVASQLYIDSKLPAWQERLGSYVLENPMDTNISYFNVNNLALVRLKNTYALQIQRDNLSETLPIRVINDTQAVIQGIGRGLGETVFAESDTLEFGGMRYTLIK